MLSGKPVAASPADWVTRTLAKGGEASGPDALANAAAKPRPLVEPRQEPSAATEPTRATRWRALRTKAAAGPEPMPGTPDGEAAQPGPGLGPDGVPTVEAQAARHVSPAPPGGLASHPVGAPADTVAVGPATVVATKPPGMSGDMQLLVAAEVLRRVNRTRQVVSLVSQVIIRSYDEEALHAEVCRHLVAFGGYLMAWSGTAEEKPERVVRPVAHAGLEANFLHALKIDWSSDLGNRSPTSRAIQEQRPHVARNIPQEPRFAVLRKEAQLYGYTATCALPLQFAQYGLGVLTIHAAEPDAFGPEEVSLLRELANDLAAGVIGLREKAKRQVLEERLVAVVDAADDAIIGCDIDGVITDWNAGATRLFGYSRTEAVGQSLGALLVPPEGREGNRRVRDAIATGERVHRFETVRICKEGKRVLTSVTVSPIFGDGMIMGATIVEHDVTAARAAEEGRRAIQVEEAELARLKSLDGLRRTFISEASHELNTPLTPLRIHVESLAASPDLTAEHRMHLAVIERNVLRLGNLVRDMLESSRLETGRFSLEFAEVPVSILIEEALSGVAEEAAQANVRLRRGHVPSHLAVVDRNRVGQVLHNFLSNAIAFSPPGTTVTASAAREDGSLVVRVRDEGVGLSAAQIEKLFQPFSRPHERLATRPGGAKASRAGTGLGLFIAKGIIEQHGGRIWAESPGPGRGSSFCFSLPDPPPDWETAARGARAPTSETRGAPRRSEP